MTFQEALVKMRGGHSVRRPGWDEGATLSITDGYFTNELGDDAEVHPVEIEATDWVVVRPTLRALETIESYMVFNEEKQRWVSTTNPEKHINAGKRVAIFSLLNEVG
jgi:hypothetical protein